MHTKKNPVVILAAAALILIGAALLLFRLTPVGNLIPQSTPVPFTPPPFSEGAAFETLPMSWKNCRRWSGHIKTLARTFSFW